MRAELTKTAAGGGRQGERGAALVTMLLVSTLLLAAGGALILTTATSTGVAGDATTEMQAYYAAEAGMQQVMAVVRRNVASNPAGTQATFRNLADNPTFAPWLAYVDVGGQQRVVVSAAPSLAYSVRAFDPDLTPAAEEPSRLLVQVRGYGPRGSVKQMEMVIQRSPYDLDPPAAITLIGAESGTSMQAGPPHDFDVGESSPKGYSGDDQAGFRAHRSPFGFTVAADRDLAEAKFAADAKASESTDETPARTALIAQNGLPSWLRTAAGARAFLNEMRAEAKGSQTPNNSNQSRYFVASPAKNNFGTDARPLLTFVDGDCDFHGDGSGLLIVTGKLTINGGSNFKGVVLLLGKAELERKGGGGGGIYGALVMGNLNGAGSAYLARPTITTSGGGNSDIKYNSVNVNRAFATLSPTVRDAREF